MITGIFYNVLWSVLAQVRIYKHRCSGVGILHLGPLTPET
ncbi:hypothetical protein D1AOALGA4SA_5631 [Olavius algarvensis Delta 1 endosymbiont]|nr:hypothetical protein D1AOALGA4SA_5631 [Olavius algarvensis Delta 1 endosymbiont]